MRIETQVGEIQLILYLSIPGVGSTGNSDDKKEIYENQRNIPLKGLAKEDEVIQDIEKVKLSHTPLQHLSSGAGVEGGMGAGSIDYREQLCLFYETRGLQDKIQNIDVLLERYQGREGVLMRKVRS